MSEIGETYAALKEAGKIKKAANQENSAQILSDNGIAFEVRNYGNHLIIRTDGVIYDFWPSTGKFIARKGKTKGRGVFNLIKKIKGE